MIEYVLVTGNDAKHREAERILGRPLARERLDLPEIQAATTAEVALVKARAAFAILARPVIIEDAGVELDAFGTFPGPFIKFWETLGGLTSICRALDGPGNRGAAAVCVLGVCTAEGSFVVEGRTAGTIAEAPRGTNGFGWGRHLHTGQRAANVRRDVVRGEGRAVPPPARVGGALARAVSETGRERNETREPGASRRGSKCGVALRAAHLDESTRRRKVIASSHARSVASAS